ncbi:MAG: glycosyltransferase [bacterium]
MIKNRNKKVIKICYIAGREAAYTRTRTIMEALKYNGYEIVSCLPPNKSFIHYPLLLWQVFRKSRDAQLIIVGFYGQLLLPWVKLFTNKKILFDLYVSTFDTMVYDRKVTAGNTLLARWFRFADRLSMQLANKIILETKDHITNYAEKFKISEEKFFHIFLGLNENLFLKNIQSKKKENNFLVHFHGEYAPFHGVEYILRAADLLRDEDIRFRIIGRGITYAKDMKLASRLKLSKVQFIDWVPYESLADKMAEADCCLGFFGTNPRAQRIFTNKVVETLAVGKPLITGRNQPVQELLEHKKNALLVRRGDSKDLAAAILQLKNDKKLRKKIAENGHNVFRKFCSMEVFSQKLKTVIEKVIDCDK